LLELQARGALLALSSKNEECDVLEVFDHHPHMILRREHLAAWRVGWANKSDALRSLAAELRLGLDSFVFVDDSAMECAHVRHELPMVDVLEVPARRYDLPRLFESYDGFEGSVTTAADASRTAHYSAERMREEAARSCRDLPSFLASLELDVEVLPADAATVGRIAQLTQRTNQFNVTTRRYDVGRIDAFRQNEDALVLGMRAKDRFGDYGLTGVAIAIRERSEGDATIRIDTFLLSCRVLSRGVEDALLSALIVAARERFGALPMVAEYIPSPKNAQVAGFFVRHGFHDVGSPGPDRRFRLPEDATVVPPNHVQFKRSLPWTNAFATSSAKFSPSTPRRLATTRPPQPSIVGTRFAT